jgi:hypothetical protein
LPIIIFLETFLIYIPQLTVLNLTSNTNLTGVLPLPEKIRDVEAAVQSENRLPSAEIIAISVSFSLLAIICAALHAYKCYFRPKIKERKRRASDDESCENSIFDEQSESVTIEGVLTPINKLPSHIMALFGSKKLLITGSISKGGFGVVYKCVFEGKDVAVKLIISPEKKKAKLRLARMSGMSSLCLPQSMKQQP